MKIERYYFVSDDLDDLEKVETELIAKGVPTPQIHVLSRDNAGVHRHEKLTGVSSFMKRDMLHSGLIGFVIGSVLALLVLLVSFLAGWMNTSAGSLPFMFLAIALLGGCTWIGGLWGIQQPNHQFRPFQKLLDEGKHVFFVDLDSAGRAVLDEVCAAHDSLKAIGTGESPPAWALEFNNRTQDLWYWRMWKNA